MKTRAAQAVRNSAALVIALAANALWLGLLAIDAVQRASPRLLEDAAPTLQVEFAPEAASRPNARAPMATAPVDARARPDPSVREASAAMASSPPARAGPSVPAPPGASSPAAVTTPTPDASAQAAAALLRRLQDCSGHASAERKREAKCLTRATGPALDGLSPERRLEFGAAGRRTSEQMDTAGDLQRSTFAPFAGGSAVRAGCILSGGKWRCGAY